MVDETPLHEGMTLALRNGPCLGLSLCLDPHLGLFEYGLKWAPPLLSWWEGVAQDPYQFSLGGENLALSI